MTVKNCIDAILETTETSRRQLAEKAGYTNVSAITKPLSRNEGMGMSVSTLIKWLDELDYQLILQPIEGGEDDDLILDGEPE